MKLFCILFFLFFLHVEAQRRTATRQEPSNPDPPIRSRGRSRFTITDPDYAKPSEAPSRRIPSRRRQEAAAPPPPPIEPPNYPPSSTQSYAVEEHIDEGDAFPKLKDLPQPILNLQNDKSAESSEEMAIPTIKIDTEKSSSSQEDFQPKVVPITRNNVRNGGTKGIERRMEGRRTPERGSRNGNSIPTPRTTQSRSNQRRPSQIEDSGSITNENAPIEPSNSLQTNQIPEIAKDEDEIRKEIVRNSMPNLPSPIGVSAILSQPPLPKKTIKKTIKTRLNTEGLRGRSNQKENFEPSQRFPSRTVEDYAARGRSSSGTDDGRTNPTPRIVEASPTPRSRSRATRKPTEPPQTFTVPSRRGGRRRNEASTTNSPPPRRGPSVFAVTEDSSSRSRTGRRIETTQASRSRSGSSRRQTERRSEEPTGKRQRFNPRSPLNIDESKLEVLPLFEGETKIISEPGKRPNQLEEVASTESLSRALNLPSFLRRRPEVRESVVSRVTEVTSKRTVTRKPIRRPGSGKRLLGKDTKSNGLTSSEENISDSDNYPEPFKALIQSKKHVKLESRPSNVPEEDAKTKKIVPVGSFTSFRSVLASPDAPSGTTTVSTKYDSENEIQPKPSSTSTTSTSRPTKKRLNPSFTNLESKNKRTTTAPRSTAKDQKFHSKFNAKKPTYRSFSAVNRKGKDGEKYNKTRGVAENGSNRIQQTPAFKATKYSSRYRSNGSARTVTRTTAPPAYIPTIPSVRSFSSTVRSREDTELGLEYISFDIPSRGVSSANLVKGDDRGADDSNALDTKRENTNQTTEKPVSIIERIINSITGINITTESTNAAFVPPATPESTTKSSAILSLAPKKPEKKPKINDVTQQKLKSNKRDASTSEKPTTIIQRILDSLSAIQAGTTTTTETTTTTDNSNQVGTSFNTPNAKITTPSNLDLETASFSSTPAPSTTIDPTVVPDEQTLQKRTIAKLLDLLNSMTTPNAAKTTKLVYVTPKSLSTLPGTSETLTTEVPITSTLSSLEFLTSSTTNEGTTFVPLTTTGTIITTTDAPLSVPLSLSTNSYVEDNVLYSTTPRVYPIIMNIKSLLGLNHLETTKVPLTTTQSPTPESLFTPTMKVLPLTTTSSSTTTTASSTTEVPPSTTENPPIETSTFPESTPIIETTIGTSDTPGTTSTFTTVPTFSKFEVSPESVSIFSSNDLLSNSITPDDFHVSTVSIPGKSTEFVSGKTTYTTLDHKSSTNNLNSINPSTKSTTPTTTTTGTTLTRYTSTPTTVGPTSTTTSLNTETTTVPLAVTTTVSTSPSTSVTKGTTQGRMGKLLQNVGDEVSNNIDSSSMGPDYFIFAILPNNTILRKRPTVYPKETPFVIVGVFPNNTIVRKYPNGTLIPMEPVIRVSGFDTRANPPPLTDITSNQVTPGGDEMDNTKLQTVSTTLVNNLNTNVPTTIGTTEMMDSTTTVESTTKEAPSSNSPDTVVSSTTLAPSTALPTELLNENTVQAFNNLVNNAPPNLDTTQKVDEDATRSSTIVTPSSLPTSTGYPSFLSTLITTLQSIGTTRVVPSTPTPIKYSSTYRAPLSTTIVTTAPSTTKVPTTTTTERVTTTTTIPTTTTSPLTTTNAPKVILNEIEDSSTPPPFTSKPADSPRTGKGLSTTVFPYFNPNDFPLLSFLNTERPRRTNEGSTTTTKTTTKGTEATTTEKISGMTESLEELLKKPIDSIKPKRKLTEQQKKDLEMIRRLEQEQAAILKQLSLLTNLNLNNLGNGGSSGNLANRIISLAKERDSRKITKPTTTRTTTTTVTTTTPKPKDEAEEERMRQIESLIRLLNMNGVTPSPQKETTYGTSNDAILASLLKERGIGPSTPKQLAEQLEQSGFFTTNEVTTKPTIRTTRKPRTTTQPTRGPLLQRLNWLFDAFAPAPTKAPSRKPKATTKKPKSKDLVTNEPPPPTTKVSPSPNAKKANSISQEDIQKLIKQLEAIQKDPSAAKNLDLTSFKSLQSLNEEKVQVFMPGSSGVSERETSRPVTRAISGRKRVTTTEPPVTETTTKRKTGGRAVRTSTSSPDDLVDDNEVVTASTKGKATIPPVRLRPVSGVSDDAGSMVRGRLLTAAVNVTRAISGFLGSAFQSAATSFQTIMGSGSRVAGTVARGSSANLRENE